MGSRPYCAAFQLQRPDSRLQRPDSRRELAAEETAPRILAYRIAAPPPRAGETKEADAGADQTRQPGADDGAGDGVDRPVRPPHWVCADPQSMSATNMLPLAFSVSN